MKFREYFALPAIVALVALLMLPMTTGPALSQADPAVDFNVPVQQQYAEWPAPELLHKNYWYPWSQWSFQRAALFGKPVFLFVDSRWNLNAHRVRTQLLGDVAVQERLNRGYITVYVDSDERPDIADRYQTGTMPIMSLLLPSGNPIITNTTPTGEGMPIAIGAVDRERMLFLLEQGNIFFDQQGEVLLRAGQEWAGKMQPDDPVAGNLDTEASDRMFLWIDANWDRSDGGFGLAPKFVIPGLPEYARLRKARYMPALDELISNYLPGILAGPLHDPVHGGIHRMAAGPDWSEIQYEKLLDRNATFLHQTTLAVLDDPSAANRNAAEGAARFILETLQAPEGGFYLGQTADFESDDGGGYWNDPERKDNKPETDRVLLSALNAQAGAALVRAGIVLNRPEMVSAGRRALDRVLKEGYRTNRGVRHMLDSAISEQVFMETQAAVAFFFLDAYQTTGDQRYRQAARNLVEYCINNFRLSGEKRFRDHLPSPNPIGLLHIRRIPFRANIQLARAMLRLGHLGADDQYFLEAEDLLAEYAGALESFRVHGVIAGLAVEEALARPVIVTLHGDPSSPRVEALRRAIVRSSAAWVLIAHTDREQDRPWPEPQAVVENGDGPVKTGEPEELVRILADLDDIGPKGANR